jgi:predicted secreted protein
MVHEKKRSVLTILILLSALAAVSAGDAARFVNLGFSPDSRVFMFAQHGISQDNGFPFAEIYAVDVPDNSFVSGGVARETYSTPLSPGQDGSGALYSLLPEMTDIVSRYRINHLSQGRLVYVLINGSEVRDRIEFRDFDAGNRYEIAITQERRGSGNDVRAAFHLDVTTHLAAGGVLTHRVGRPGYFRDDVDRYRINQVIVSPDERSIVVVIERIRDLDSGMRIRYMVETVTLR